LIRRFSARNAPKSTKQTFVGVATPGHGGWGLSAPPDPTRAATAEQLRGKGKGRDTEGERKRTEVWEGGRRRREGTEGTTKKVR